MVGATASTRPHRIVVWFRNDLRIHDNPTLNEAFSYEGPKEVSASQLLATARRRQQSAASVRVD
jgi:deoxyribodipyrimidine photolyase|tara:strand:- start:1984 stop:2175 length:192 start_codon:yes stop_codon:yes gene_type:complete